METTVHKEAFKFLIVGGLSTILNYAVFFIAYDLLNINYIISSALGYAIGLIFGYILNRNWTFAQDKAEKKGKELMFYILVYVFSLVASLLFLKLLVDVISLNPLIANVFAIGLSTCTNFIGLKFIVFKKKNEKN